MRSGVEPLQEALLEKVGRIGVVIGARGVHEHVTPARVAVHVGLGGVEDQRRQFRVRNPVVGICDMDAQAHIVPPLAADLCWGHGPAHEHTIADAAPLLGEQLGGKGAERKPNDGIRGGVMECGAAGDVLDGVVPDAAGIGDAVVESREHLACKHVGRVHRVPGRAETINKRAQSLGKSLCVMEQQNLGHASSVRLKAFVRDCWPGRSRRSNRRYPRRMENNDKRDRSLALGWLLVAVQVVLFLAVAFWPSSWGPTVRAARELGGALFFLGGLGIIGAAVHLGRALTPIPQPNGAGLRVRGVYRWVRHPMYTSVLLLCVGVAAARGSVVVWALVASLGVFFEAKTRLEEKFLIEAYDGYATYASRTGKFVPGVGRRR